MLGTRPVELDQLIERRNALGQDLYDEVWEGVYHMAPEARLTHAYLDDQVAIVLHPYARAAGLIGSGPFNLGEPGDFRVPDRGYHRDTFDAVYAPTAAIVVEILSPDDETFEKLPFYAARGVDEVIIADPDERRVRILARSGDRYDDVDRSALLGIDASSVAGEITWP